MASFIFILINDLYHFQSAIPVRHKESHFMNIPTYANKILDFAMSVLSDKLKKRIFVSILIIIIMYFRYKILRMFTFTVAQEYR